MNHQIQSAFDAAKRGENKKALELCIQVLAVNPNDVDAWLLIASVVDQPERKRQCLNRILRLDPVNESARKQLLELDRIATGVPPYNSSQNPSDILLKRPLAFRYSKFTVAFLYLFTGIFVFSFFLSLDNRDTASTIFWLVMALVSGPLAVSITPEITVTQTGIRSSAPWGSEKIEWNDIARVKPMPAKRIFKVISSRRESVTIHTRSRDYPAFIELLCQQRPDLFEADAISPGDGPGMTQDFRSERIFRKGFFRQYLPALGGIIFCPLMILAVPDGNMNWNFTSLVVVSLLIALDGLLILMPFFAVHTIKLEPNKLTLSTFFGDREIPTSRIQEIKINQVYGQMDRVWNYVHIRFTDKKRCGLGGFAEGAEIIYGSLMNWWNTYKSK